MVFRKIEPNRYLDTGGGSADFNQVMACGNPTVAGRPVSDDGAVSIGSQVIARPRNAVNG